MVRFVCHTAAAAVAVLPAALWGQKPIALGKPDAEFSEPFTQIGAIRELKDGRVLVADPRDKIVLLIDLRSGASTKAGREGSGPGEYTLPQRIVALPADTSAIYDPTNARYLLIGPDGKTGATVRIDEMTGGRGGRGGAAPKGSDARGRVYFEGGPFVSTTDGGLAAADSAPVLRYDRMTRKTDTVTYVHLAKGNAQVSGGDGRLQMVVGRRAFPSRDDWVAFPDGSVAVARVRDYHVDRYPATGKTTSGGPVRVDAIAVTEADKEEWRAARRAVAGSGRQLGRGGAPSPGRAASGPAPEPEFPAFKPPFVNGEAFARPNGELWVLRSRKANDHVAVYDVFNATGTMTARVSLAAKTRLAGFGNGTLYAVRADEDDLQYLQRYRLP